jgi:hypothetical protein
MPNSSVAKKGKKRPKVKGARDTAAAFVDETNNG